MPPKYQTSTQELDHIRGWREALSRRLRETAERVRRRVLHVLQKHAEDAPRERDPIRDLIS